MGQLGQTATTEEPLLGDAAPAPAGAVPPEASGPSLLFRAGGLLCAVPVAEVIETMRPLAVHRLAGAPPFMAGLTIMRGRPAPVVDTALMLTGETTPPARFIAVRTERGPVALATGPVVDIRTCPPDTTHKTTALLGSAAALVAAIGTAAGEPVFLLRSMRMVPDDVWGAVAQHAPGGDSGPESDAS